MNEDQELQALQFDLNEFSASLARLKADALAQRSALLKHQAALSADRLFLDQCSAALRKIQAAFAEHELYLGETKALLAELRSGLQEQKDAPQEP